MNVSEFTGGQLVKWVMARDSTLASGMPDYMDGFTEAPITLNYRRTKCYLVRFLRYVAENE